MTIKDDIKFIIINGIKVEKKILDFYFKCINKSNCKSKCCYLGAYVTKEEIQRIRKDILKIKKYLSEQKIKRLNKLHNKFVENKDWNKLWKIRTWNGSCIFLMENGECAVHRFCIENKINWIDYKFNICVTFPLDIRPHENIIEFMNDLENEEFDIWCLRLPKEEKIKLGIRPIIYTMKEVIINRLGYEFWKELEKEYIKKS
ncbi:MAG: DUF3109 family protein [Candidatus Helarchaeota archaeon]